MIFPGLAYKPALGKHPFDMTRDMHSSINLVLTCNRLRFKCNVLFDSSVVCTCKWQPLQKYITSLFALHYFIFVTKYPHSPALLLFFFKFFIIIKLQFLHTSLVYSLYLFTTSHVVVATHI